MSSDPHIETLLHPLQSGAIDGPLTGEVLCIGLSDPLAADALAEANVTYVQGFRPAYLKLERTGCVVTPDLPAGTKYHHVLIRLGRHRAQNEAWLAAALRCTRTGGSIIVAGDKTDGAASLRKRVSETALTVEHRSLNHGVVFWLTAVDQCDAVADILQPASSALVDGRFFTAPGMFSHGKIDPGSRLLADQLNGGLSGDVADFCAGWGYLSARLLESSEKIRQLDLFEADYASIEAAKSNIADSGDATTHCYWHDLAGEPVENQYDLIIMNPPFHTGRKAEPDIGVRLIEIAANALVKNGRLFMVANRQLPYENTLISRFSKVDPLIEDNRYKVFCATK